MKRALLVATLSACVTGDPGATPSFDVEPLISPDKLAEKVTIARMFVQGTPVLDDLNPGLPATRSLVAHDALATEYGKRVAERLEKVSTDFTYISGLIRINDPSYELTPDEKTAFRAVRAEFPGAKLDITLSMHSQGSNNDAPALIALMKRLDADLSPGVWFYDFFNEGTAAHDVIEFVHTHQQHKLIGGNYSNSAPADANGTEKADFFAVVDNKDFVLDQQRINGLHNSFHAPVLMHFGNNPQDEPLDASGTPKCVVDHTQCVETACQFIYNWDATRQANYVTMRVNDHAKDNYHYMYNVFFPACPLTKYYEAPPSVVAVMHDLIK